MKETELRQHTDCSVCKRKIGHVGLPLFWRVSIERFGIDLNTARRQDGLAAMLGGNAFLAMHMGADEDMARPLMDKIIVTVCESCALEQVCIAAIAEDCAD